MNDVQEKREKIIAAINSLPDDKLVFVEELIKNISAADKSSVEFIYKRAIERYHETLQKLAQ